MLASPQPAWRRDTLIWARRLFRGQEHETKVLLHKMAKASSSSSSILLIAIRVRSLTGGDVLDQNLATTVERCSRGNRELGSVIVAEIVNVAQLRVDQIPGRGCSVSARRCEWLRRYR